MAIAGSHDKPPPPLDVEGALAYSVCSLLDSQHRGGSLQYLVNCEGFSQSGLPQASSRPTRTASPGSSPRSAAPRYWSSTWGGIAGLLAAVKPAAGKHPSLVNLVSRYQYTPVSNPPSPVVYILPLSFVFVGHCKCCLFF